MALLRFHSTSLHDLSLQLGFCPQNPHSVVVVPHHPTLSVATTTAAVFGMCMWLVTNPWLWLACATDGMLDPESKTSKHANQASQQLSTQMVEGNKYS